MTARDMGPRTEAFRAGCNGTGVVIAGGREGNTSFFPGFAQAYAGCTSESCPRTTGRRSPPTTERDPPLGPAMSLRLAPSGHTNMRRTD